MGDIQISLFDRRGTLEIEIIRAKGLLVKQGAKALPGKCCHFLFSKHGIFVECLSALSLYHFS